LHASWLKPARGVAVQPAGGANQVTVEVPPTRC
jgi:hypothetical protein